MSVRPILFGFECDVRVDSLSADHFLELTCQGCKAMVRVAPWQLYARFPPRSQLYRIDPLWRCKACCARGRFTWHTMQAVAQVEVVPPIETARRKLRDDDRQERQRRAQEEEADGGEAA